MYQIQQIKLRWDESIKNIPDKIAKRAKIKKNDIIHFEIAKESIDARKKPNVYKIYTVNFETKKHLNLPKIKKSFEKPIVTKLAKDTKIAIVGFGPAGIFAGLTLAQNGYKPVIIERGEEVDKRSESVSKFWKEGILNEESNVQFGEGGAGTFSDGKLTTGVKDVGKCKVLQAFVNAGANDEILYKQKPHIGTDVLKVVVKNIRKEIIELGGKICFESKLVDIHMDEKMQRVTSIDIEHNGENQNLKVDKLILAIGHSARDTFELIHGKNLNIQQKNFSLGFRVEHPQELIDVAQYGDSEIAKTLGAADYKLNCKVSNGRGVYTFCMCPGGEIVLASSGKGQVVTNGMSYSKRNSGKANSALLVDVRCEDFESEHPLAGMYFQEKYERKAYEMATGYNFLETTYKDYRNSKLYEVLPQFVNEAVIDAMPVFGRKIKGFDDENTLFKGIETRSSSPIRIVRDDEYQSNIRGIYPIGEGAGYAGGIMSAAIDGIKVAEFIISQDG